MLVGRERETERLRRVLADARLGRSATVVLRGDPGVGKTALLDLIIQEAQGFDVLHAVGVESEADLPYAVLHALLRPFVSLLDELPDVQAHALRVALALEDGNAEPFLASAGTLTLLAHAAERRPLLLAVDDAHWLDRASRDALLFVARRLEAESIACVFVVRTGERALERSGIAELAVEPLTEPEALELLNERWGAELDPSVARKLVVATEGNALGLVEVSQHLTEDERLGRTPLSEPLPVSRAVEQGVRLRLNELTPAARSAALLAAVDDFAVGLVGHEDLVPAERAGLLQLYGDRVVFVHPLFRAAVYHSASPEDRRAAHRRIADALTDDGAQDLRAWHLAAAADGVDEEAAAVLEAAADRAEARGGTAARAHALERAAELSEDESARGRRLYAAARAAQWAGETRHARDLIERALPTAHDPLVRADLMHALTSIASWQEPPLPAAQLEAEAAMVAELDAERAAKLLIIALQTSIDNRIGVPDALRVAAQLELLVPKLGDWWRPRALGDMAFAYQLAGNAHRARELVTDMLRDPLAAATQGLLLIRIELYDEARNALDVSLELGRSAGQPLRVAWTQMCLGRLDYTLGRTAQALAASSEAVALAQEIDADSIAVSGLLTLAEISADQGRADRCRELTLEAEELGTRLDDETTRLAARLALGRLALTQGRHDEVVELLEPVAARLRESGRRDVTFVPYETDLVEAQIRRGNTAAARAILDRFAVEAAGIDCHWALATVARYEAMLAPQADFERDFEAALERHAEVAMPLADARTRLCYGELLRRARRRRKAREQLRAALTIFEELGADAWSARARTELEATGETIPRRDPTAPERLTPQELQIALQVSEGKTNREVAAVLFLSPKTVEYHLTHIYRKLDIHSRAELVRLLATDSEVLRRARMPSLLLGSSRLGTGVAPEGRSQA